MKSIEVKDIHAPEIQQLIVDMAETMDHAKGVGIAAVQVGENIQICWINFGHARFPVINPRLTLLTDRMQTMEEGCLSYPGIWGNVVRAKKVKLEGLDAQGNPISFEAKDYLARVMQHEFDHLQGRVIVDKFVK